MEDCCITGSADIDKCPSGMLRVLYLSIVRGGAGERRKDNSMGLGCVVRYYVPISDDDIPAA